VIWLLFVLLAALLWAIWFILQWDILLPLLGSAVVGLAAGGLYLYRFLRARRSARALEMAIAQQGKQQLESARPDKRAEIEALQKQISDGIHALKASKLGGKRRGAAALYALPWYAIIGPPGAGKTTALRHSGLIFPYADSAVRGVGGTRNCDWWFTNDAILLDTAGRYTTEHEDQAEWHAFLDLLHRYRGNKPLNGLFVAVAVTDIVDATEEQLAATAHKLRQRIDEVMTRLHMVLPVYVLITKCDLIAGFVELFGDLKKSDRQQAWGATFKLGEDRSNPGALFAREFDVLVHNMHKRAVRRMSQERNRVAREAVYQFPLELAGIKRNLQDLIHNVFLVNAFQGTPLLRGFYFSSGTQEGTPLSRVLQRMGQAMGIRPPELATQQKVESKSYFLHDVFMKIAFPDADVAARSAAAIRRQALVRIGVSAAACAVAATLAIPSTVSFFKNRSMLRDTLERAEAAAKIQWDDAQPVRAKLKELDPLLERLKEIDAWERDGVPFGMRFLMYSGDDVYRPAVKVYVANMQQGFVKRCKYWLEKRLNELKGGQSYFEERLWLKTYLMLSDVENLDVEWASGKYTGIWSELQKATSDVALPDLRRAMKPHVRYYFELVKPEDADRKPRAAPVPANDKIVAKARQVLQSVEVRKRYFALFVESVIHEKYEESGDAVRSNLQYPPVTLDAMFTDRQEVLKYLRSKRHRDKQGYFEVPGPYTDKGHYKVLANVENAAILLESEQWVVPLTDEERQEDRIAANVKQLAEDYEEGYIASWRSFLLDLDVQTPTTLKEAAELYAVLATPEWPLLRVLRAVEDHTQWRKDLSPAENKKLQSELNRRLNRAVTSKTGGLRWNLDVNKIVGRVSRVPSTFKRTVAVGVPEPGKGPPEETSLARYMEMLAALRNKILTTLERQPDAPVQIVGLDLQNAFKQTEALLQPFDDTARTTVLPLLQPPLNVGGKVKAAGPAPIFGATALRPK
jgi:type VI secretion system protein ImpL